MPEELAIDTSVLVRANVTQTRARAAATLQAARLALLQRIQDRQASVLISERLAAEYGQRVTKYKNEFVRLFFDLVTKPDGSHVILNWRTPWGHAELARADAVPVPVRGSTRSTNSRPRWPHNDLFGGNSDARSPSLRQKGVRRCD